MAESNYNNRGSLWKRQPRDTDVDGKKYPQYQGNFIDAGGVKKNCALWINSSKEKEAQPDISFSVSDIIEKK